MALTINNFWGAESGGLEAATLVQGSVTASTEQAHTGTYSFKFPSGDFNRLQLDPFESVTDQGNDYICGFWIYFTDKTPTGTEEIWDADDNATVGFIGLSINSSSDLLVTDANNATIRTISDPFSLNTWHFVEVYFQNSATGTVEVFIDGVSQGSDTSQDLDTGSPFSDIDFASGVTSTLTYYVDDVYFMSGATAASDRLGGCEVISYRSNLNSATGDAGGALDIGTWLAAQTVPFSGTIGAEYIDAGAGSVDTNDVGGSAGTGGPNTDTNIDGDIKAIKGICRMERSGGGAAAHYILLGNSVDGTTRSADLNPTTSAANYAFVSEAATIVPTSSEYCRIGFETTGSQDFECYDMLATVLHVPATATPFPYHAVKQNRRDQKSLVTL